MRIEKVNENQIRCTLTREDLEARHLKLSELAYGSAKAKALFTEMMRWASYKLDFDIENAPLMVEAVPLSADSILLIVTKVLYPEELDTRFSNFTDEDDIDDDYDDDPEDRDVSDDILTDEELIPTPPDAREVIHELSADSTEPLPPDSAEDVSPAGTVSSSADDANRRSSEMDPKANSHYVRFFRFDSLDNVIRASAVLDGFYHGPNTLFKTGGDSYLLVCRMGDHTPDQFNRVCNILSEFCTPLMLREPASLYLKEHGKILIGRQAVHTLAAL